MFKITTIFTKIIIGLTATMAVVGGSYLVVKNGLTNPNQQEQKSSTLEVED